MTQPLWQAWHGMFLLGTLSYVVAKSKNNNPLGHSEHLLIALVVIILTMLAVGSETLADIAQQQQLAHLSLLPRRAIYNQ